MSKRARAVAKQQRAKKLLSASKYNLQVALTLDDPAERRTVIAKAQALASEAKELSNEARAEYR